jgi:hypothetical protein
MTSKDDVKCSPAVLEERRRSPLDHLPPPANSNKPLTPFSIEDILSKPAVKRSYSICGAAHLISCEKTAGHGLSGRALLSQTSPLCALEELASKTFKGLEVSVLQAAEGRKPRGDNIPLLCFDVCCVIVVILLLVFSARGHCWRNINSPIFEGFRSVCGGNIGKDCVWNLGIVS